MTLQPGFYPSVPDVWTIECWKYHGWGFTKVSWMPISRRSLTPVMLKTVRHVHLLIHELCNPNQLREGSASSRQAAGDCLNTAQGQHMKNTIDSCQQIPSEQQGSCLRYAKGTKACLTSPSDPGRQLQTANSATRESKSATWESKSATRRAGAKNTCIHEPSL